MSEHTEAVVKLIEANVAGERERIQTDERVWIHGCLRQRDRIAAIAAYCAQNWPGDFIEIGCLHGGTTRYLAEVARRFGRRILCVDPWPTKCPLTNTDYGPDPYGTFRAAMAEWWDILDVFKTESQNVATVAAIKARPLAFAFVDGMHTYEAARADIATVAHTAGVICVDDTLWEAGVGRAFEEGATALRREAVSRFYCRESWLIP